MICVFIIRREHPKAHRKWFYGFMEKPGIEPATPGLQGIALIPYTFFVSFLGINQFHRVGLR